MELAKLYVAPMCLCCQCDLIVVVVRVSQCTKGTVDIPLVAAASGSSVFIGCREGAAEWDTETGVVTKVAEHTDEFPWFRRTTGRRYSW